MIFALSIYWHLPILLIVISLVYCATRHDNWMKILKESLAWMIRMTTFLGGLGVTLYILSSYPYLWPYAAVLFGCGTLLYYLVTSKWFQKKWAQRLQKKIPDQNRQSTTVDQRPK